jgi:hypothetical protein
MERVPVEVWQQILLKVMETNDWPIFTTSCTPYTFLCFMELHTGWHLPQKPYLDYLAQRRCLRLVCRAWNAFVLFTSHRWLRLEDRSPVYELDLTTTTRAEGGVGPVESLSMTISSAELVIPTLSWVSHILKRPAHQSPLRAFTLRLLKAPARGYNPFDDLLVKTTTTQDPECTNTNTNTALRLLSIAGPYGNSISISFSQISRTFTGLRSLFLFDVTVTPQQTLTLVHLEVLHLRCWCSGSEALLQESMEKWDTPALRHVFLPRGSTPLTDVIDRFLGRYAHQIESLDLSTFVGYPADVLYLPSGFWAQFTALRLLGLDEYILRSGIWPGWSIVPPPTHPCRYLVCRINTDMTYVIDAIRSRWTWHDGVKLVAVSGYWDKYFIVKDIRDGLFITSMEKTVGILPES